MEWTKDDADQLRAYLLASNRKLIQYLQSKIPRVDGDSFERIALLANYNQGRRDNIEEIEQAAVSVAERRPTVEFVDVTEGIPR